MKAGFAFAVAMAAAPIEASADDSAVEDAFITGNVLYEDCAADGLKTPVKLGNCIGYITGVVDAHAIMVSAKLTKCVWKIPDHVTTGQLQDIVQRWLEEHPADRHLVASSLVFNAIKEAFPSCKN